VTLTIQEGGGSGSAGVTVAAGGASASRIGPTSGSFTFIRSGSTAEAVTVNFTLGGSAVNGVDYNTLPTSITIPVGVSSATLNIVPKTSTSLVGDKNVTLTVSSGPAPASGQSANATLVIAGNSVRSAIREVPGGGMRLSWQGVSGKNYRVAFRPTLTSGNWTDISGNVTASNSAPAWTDPTAGIVGQRFYIVYQTN
jgi:hypothetical protein